MASHRRELGAGDRPAPAQGKRRIAAPVLAGVGALLLLLNAIALAGRLGGDFNSFLDLAAQFLLPAAVAGTAGTLALLVTRRWRAAAAGFLVAGLSLAIVWPYGDDACPAGTSVHRALFLNTWGQRRNVLRTAQVFSASGADILVLAEVLRPVSVVGDPLLKTFPYITILPTDAKSATLVASKFPIAVAAPDAVDGSLGAVSVQLPEGKVFVAGAHLARPWPFRPLPVQAQNAAHVAQVFKSLPEPRLLLGDFNSVSWSHAARLIASETGARTLRSWGTWPRWYGMLTRLPIDQALVGKGIACAHKSVMSHMPWAHVPILLDFSLR